MKKTLTILILLTTIGAHSQPLMLSCRKATIKAEMRRNAEWQVEQSKVGLKYTYGVKTIEYGLIGRICVTASIEMPTNQAEKFVTDKLDCNCWCEAGIDTWVYNTQLFDSPVIVNRTIQGDKTKFTYKLN